MGLIRGPGAPGGGAQTGPHRRGRAGRVGAGPATCALPREPCALPREPRALRSPELGIPRGGVSCPRRGGASSLGSGGRRMAMSVELT